MKLRFSVDVACFTLIVVFVICAIAGAFCHNITAQHLGEGGATSTAFAWFFFRMLGF